MTQPQWHEETSRRIASEIRRLRGDRSAQWLSDRTAEVGFRVSRSTISDMEVGRRTRLELVELIALAYALGVPPVALIYPDTPDGQVDYMPGITIDSWTATKLFAGYQEAPDIDNRRIDLLRRHDEAMDRLERSYEGIRIAMSERVPEVDRTPDRDQLDTQREAMAHFHLRSTIDYIKRLRGDMRDIGMTPPKASDFIDNEPQQQLFDTGGQQ